MTEQDYNYLQLLLSKLQTELKHRFCIIPNHILDSTYIGIYSENGNILKEANCVDIKSTVDKLNKQD